MRKKNYTSPEQGDNMEDIMKRTFAEIGEKIEASDCLKRQIDCRILEEKEKEKMTMKHFSTKKVVIGVIVASLLVGTVVVAANGMKYIKGQAPATPQYTDFEDKEKAEAEAGQKIEGKENLDNGFEMNGITVGEEVMVDETGKETEKKKTIRMEYKRGDDTISYSSDNLMEGQTEASIMSEAGVDSVFEYQGKQLAYHELRHIGVTPDYVLSDEEQKAMDEGELSVGVDSIGGEDVPIYSMYWVNGNKKCGLFGYDLKMSPEEAKEAFLEVAKEIIDIQLSEQE